MWKIKHELPKKFSSGVLPPYDYHVTYDEIKESILIEGDGSSTTWDKEWRLKVLSNFLVLAKQLWAAGVEDIYLDGSFVEDKDHPNDIDGYFDTGIKLKVPEDFDKWKLLQAQLNAKDPYKIWDWTTRLPAGNSEKAQLSMWHRYRVELYPHYGNLSGIKDEHGHDQEFPAAFRRRRGDSKKKGIVKMIQRRNK